MKKQAVLISIISIFVVTLTVLSWDENSVVFLGLVAIDVWVAFQVKDLIKKRREAKSFYLKVLRKYKEILYIRSHLNNIQYNQLYYNFSDNPKGFLESEYTFIERCKIKYIRYKDFLSKNEAQEIQGIFDKTEKQKIQEVG